MKWNIGWGLTSACNSGCRHCYNASGGAETTQISFDEAKKIVDVLAAHDVECINYGTGESGLVPFFWNLVEYVYTKNIAQGLTTNGSSVNEKSIHLIEKYMNDIDVSIDYPDRTRDNDFRGSEEAWDWAINACNLLKSHNINFSVVTCLHALNSDNDTIFQFLDICKNLECEWRVNWFKPTGRGKFDDRLKLDGRKVHDIFRFIVEHSEIIALPDPYFSAITGVNSRVGSPCGCESFRITPTAEVVPCVYFSKEMHNLSLTENSFEDVVNSYPMQQVKSRNVEFCANCEYKEFCNSGCISRAYLEYGTMDAPDAFCFKKNGFVQNPLLDLKCSIKDGPKKVHENYLCTMIVKPL